MTAKEIRENKEYYQQLIFEILENNYDTIFSCPALARELNKKGISCNYREIMPLVSNMIEDRRIKKVKYKDTIFCVTSYTEYEEYNFFFFRKSKKVIL